MKGDFLRRSPNAWLSVCSVALLIAAGCGGDDTSPETERLDPGVAEQLAVQSDAVADAIEVNDGCAATDRASELKATLDAAAGRGEVPETIRREVARIVNREFRCVVSPPAPPPLPPPPPPSTDEEDDDD